MRKSLIGNENAWPVSALTASSHAVKTAALAAILLGGSPRESAAQTLRWKLNPGEVLHYAMEAKQVASFNVMGRNKKSTRTSTINLSWTVKSVSASGSAEISLRFDRVRMRIDQPPIIPLEFDSAPNKLEVPEEFESAERQIKALAGAEFTFTLKPTGEVEDLKIPPQTLKTLRDGAAEDAAGQGQAQGQGLISEQGLKDLLLQSSPPTFPAGSLEPGKSWTGKPSKASIPGLGSLKIDQVFTFDGPDPRSPKLLLVGLEARVALEPAQNVTAKIRKQEGKGSLTFDAEAGRIVSSRNNQKMEMAISDRGQDIVQITETSSSMTLEP